MNLQTVTGTVGAEGLGYADGHAHAWIMPPDDTPPAARLLLNDTAAIIAELMDFKAAGGGLIVDCQPGGCGRDARKLAEIAGATGLAITCTTGHHLSKYYAAGHWLWSASVEDAAAYFVEELTSGTRESGGTIRATTIKVGYDAEIVGQKRVLMEAAALAAKQTGAAVLFHTEQGRSIEALVPFFEDRGVPPTRLYMCHVDKRPDFGLHRELARAGVLLGYDTFVRPRYNPEEGVWPLLAQMVEAGLGSSVAIGLDLALSDMWHYYGGQPGMLALTEEIVPRLRKMGVPESDVRQLAGENIARLLVWTAPDKV